MMAKDTGEERRGERERDSSLGVDVKINYPEVSELDQLDACHRPADPTPGTSRDPPAHPSLHLATK